MAQFSGAVKLADLDDYLAPSQACIKPQLDQAKQQKEDQLSAQSTKDPTKPTQPAAIRLELEHDLAYAPATAAPLLPPGSHFNQMKTTAKQTATITLSDCLACSGCVTSAETVLISQQSLEQFQNVLRLCIAHDEQSGSTIGNSACDAVSADESMATQALPADSTAPQSSSPFRRIVISLSPQSRTALAHHFKLAPLAFCKKLQHHLQHAQHLQLAKHTNEKQPQQPQQHASQSAIATLLDTSSLSEVALREASLEFCQRWRLHQETHLPSNSQSNAMTDITASTASPAVSLAQQRIDQPLPLFTSECPGFVVYSEKTQPASMLRHLSRVQSPQQLCGSIVKYQLARKELYLEPRQIFHVTVMPCYDKKLESARQEFVDTETETHSVDCVLTTDEFRQWIEQEQHLATESDWLAVPEASLHPTFFACNADQSSLVLPRDTGASGAYCETIFRRAVRELFHVSLPADVPLHYVAQRNADLRELTYIHTDPVTGVKQTLRFALAYGFRNIQNLMRLLKSNQSSQRHKYDYVELMACPSGCLNGGGQIKAASVLQQKQLTIELDALYHSSAHQFDIQHQAEPNSVSPAISDSTPSPTQNLTSTPAARRVYEDWLSGAAVGSDLARTKLHTSFRSIQAAEANPLGIKW